MKQPTASSRSSGEMNHSEASPLNQLSSPPPTHSSLFGISIIKWVFALEYALQGLVNPFQGMTYQPFLNHVRLEYGLGEAAIQHLFAKSYLAWSAKPLIGFFVDAYGRTRTLLLGLFACAAIGFLLTPLLDRSALLFFASMFLISVVLAATDVVVDRATVLTGADESKKTGRSKSATIGLNQAICWTAVYGSSIAAAVLGGYAAERLPFSVFLISLSVVPATVLLVSLRLPADRAEPIPLSHSVLGFWRGLHTGPLLEVMLFYFVFNFQPSMGPIWTTHLLTDLHFSQSQVGIGDAASYAGSFLGVLAFAWKGINWQDRFGHRRLFRLYIVVSIIVSLTQFLLLDPWFSQIARCLAAAPLLHEPTARLLYLCGYNLAQGVVSSVVRMSTFSLVGTVTSTAAAGSLFAGFMSVANLAAGFSYSSGSWLYEHGRQWHFIRNFEAQVQGIPVGANCHLSISTLLAISSLAYLLSFACVHVLPGQRETSAPLADAQHHPGPERWNRLPNAGLRLANWSATLGFVALIGLGSFVGGIDLISSIVASLFLTVLLRKWALDIWSRYWSRRQN